MNNCIEAIDADRNCIRTTLSDGTVVMQYFHVCPTCTSVDTWVVSPVVDVDNCTGDQRRRQVDIAVWDKLGHRQFITGTTTNHIVRHDQGDAA